MRADLPRYDPQAVEDFFARSGFGCHRVDTRWRFAGMAALASVLKIEFGARVAAAAIAEVLRDNEHAEDAETAARAGDRSVTLPVSYRVHVRVKPTGLAVPGHASASGSSTSPRMP